MRRLSARSRDKVRVPVTRAAYFRKYACKFVKKGRNITDLAWNYDEYHVRITTAIPKAKQNSWSLRAAKTPFKRVEKMTIIIKKCAKCKSSDGEGRRRTEEDGGRVCGS